MLSLICLGISAAHLSGAEPSARAVGFERTVVYRPPENPGFAAWVQLWREPGGGWTGWRRPDEYPRIVDPPSGRVWSANARTIDTETWLAFLGDGGYDLGARAALESVTPTRTIGFTSNTTPAEALAGVKRREVASSEAGVPSMCTCSTRAPVCRRQEPPSGASAKPNTAWLRVSVGSR